jgi:hypothetical protein
MRIGQRSITIKQPIKREVRYLCPECFTDMDIELINMPRIEFSSKNDIKVEGNKAKKIQFVCEGWLSVYGKCNNCKYDGEFIDIDTGFVELIQYLNAGPYITKYCCTGHYIKDENNYDHPYLVFLCNWDDKTYNKMLRHLPESWNMWKINTSKDFGCYQEIRLYCDNYYKYPDCIKDLENYIYKWFPYPKN